MSETKKNRIIGKRPDDTKLTELRTSTRVVAPSQWSHTTGDPGQSDRLKNESKTNEEKQKTRIYTPPPELENNEETTPEEKQDVDPVVGWLVIIDGPGQGRSFELVDGMNALGSDPLLKIPLQFGDESISDEAQAYVSYDERNNKFYVSHGAGRTLWYLNEEPLLQPTELVGGESIRCGKTTLKFVRFCDESFRWG